MANTRKAPPKKVTATPPAKQDEIDNPIRKPETANADSVPKSPIKIDDSVLVRVQSNCHGQLVYDNPRTGSNVVWPRFGDVQSVPMGDLRSMKAGQRKFFEDNWVIIRDIDDAGYNDVSPEDVYKSLGVSQYYKELIDPDHFDEFFRLDCNEMKRRIDLMTEGAKLNLVVAANSAIESGILDSIRTVKMLEELLGCELLEIK